MDYEKRITHRLRSFDELFFAPDQPKFDVRFGAKTHKGKVRAQNEDHHACVRRTRASEILLTNLELGCHRIQEDEAFAMCVADGIGGAAFGEFASRLALETMLELSGRATSWLMKFTDLDAQNIRRRVHAYLDAIQDAFRQHGKADPGLRGMGTTWTSAHLFPPHVVFVHIGDSRAYVYHDGRLRQVTRDQTLAQDMVDAGMAMADARRFRHTLTNSLDGQKSYIDPDVEHVELQDGDRILLCTDGLSDMIDDVKIAEGLALPDPQAACDQLVEDALDGGGKDNITVVISELKVRAKDDHAETGSASHESD